MPASPANRPPRPSPEDLQRPVPAPPPAPATTAGGGSACWVRLLPVGVGLASVDAETPQLGIALESEFQHKGYGRLLMLEAMQAFQRAGYKQVALTVHPENPAQFMYERCGFRRVGLRNTYHLMVASVA